MSLPNDPYSFSKKIVEDIGDYYWRRCGISSVGLRLPAVYPPEHLSSKKFLQEREQMQYLLDTFAQVPEQERLKRLEAAAKKGSMKDIFEAVSQFCAGNPLSDDCTVVELSYSGE